MKKNEHMIIYNNTFWNKLKMLLKNIFFKDKTKDSKEETEITENNIQLKSKEEVLEIYNSVKSGKMKLEELDNDCLYKVMMLLKEELSITNTKIKNELQQIEIQLNNLKIYNKEIELLKENS